MDQDALIGRTLDGKYWPESLLGKGGMGAVYLATHIHTRRRVALKVISPQYMNDREFVVRFQREAEASGRLRHPNVVNVTDFGVADSNGQPMAYLVMEYMDGQTLSDSLRITPKMVPSLAVEVIEQVALAIDEAHRLGIVHRDLKPDNIWLESNRRGAYNVKVLDFGIAKLNDSFGPVTSLPEFPAESRGQDAPWPAADEAATQEIVLTQAPKTTAIVDASGFSTTVGTVLGTPAYMSPEQCRGESAEGASDIYSLGVIAYQLITGELPFEGKGLDLVRQHVEETPRSPRDRDNEIPAGLSRAVMSALEKDPARRPATGAAFSALLRVDVDGPPRLIRESRDLSSRASILFLLLPLTFLPFALAVAFAGPRLPWWGVPLFAILITPLVLSLMTGASALAFRQMRDTNGAAVEARMLLREYFALLPRLLPTQALWLLQPWQWSAGILAAAVLVFEGKSGTEALRRSSRLTASCRKMAGEIVIRLLSISAIASLYFPIVISFAGAPFDGIPLLLNSVSWPMRLLMAMMPASLSFWFLAYSGGVPVLYLWARSASGEPLPMAGAAKLRKTGPPIAKYWWIALPWLAMLLLGVTQYRTYVNGKAVDLIDAAAEGRVQAVRGALARGTDVNSRGRTGRTALMYAAEWGNVAMVQASLDAGADVNLKDNAQRTALHRSVMGRSPEIARMLLAKGAAVDAADDDGDTPLIAAVKSSQPEIAAMLRKAGADPDRKAESGKSARDFAREEGNAAILDVLK
jgi:serine/threonine protein kinase